MRVRVLQSFLAKACCKSAGPTLRENYTLVCIATDTLANTQTTEVTNIQLQHKGAVPSSSATELREHQAAGASRPTRGLIGFKPRFAG